MRKIFNSLILSGIMIFIVGLYFWMIKAGLPYQDPTPEMSFNYAVNYRVGQVLLLLGAATLVIGGVGRIVIYMTEKRKKLI